MPDLLLAATRCTRRNLEVILLPLYLPPCGQSCWPYAQGVCGMWPLLTTPSVTTWSKPSLLPTSPLCLWASLLSSWSCHSSQSGRVRRKSVPITPWLQREQHFPPFTQSSSQGPLHGFLILEGLPLLPLSPVLWLHQQQPCLPLFPAPTSVLCISFRPQGLCTCYVLCLECCPPGFYMAPSLPFFRSLLIGMVPWPSQLKF